MRIGSISSWSRYARSRRLQRALVGLGMRARHRSSYDEEDGEDEPVRRRRAASTRQLAERVGAVIAGVLLALLCAEAMLRIPGLPLPRDLGTYLFQCYSSEYEGAVVTYSSAPLSIRLPKPHFDGTCYWNGHRWRHRSDGWGFRNPETYDHADVVLLGDSMIYGHGVEESQTTASFLRKRMHRRVANLAFMGYSFPDELAVLQNFGLPLKPKLVVLFIFHNDLTDILQTQEPERIRRFVATEVGPETTVLPRDAIVADAQAGRGTFWSWLSHETLTLRTIRYYASARYPQQPLPPKSVEPRLPLPNLPLAPPAPTPELALATDYAKVAVRLMKEAVERNGARLMVAFLPGIVGPDPTMDRLLFYHSREIAADLGLPFLDATPAMVDERGVAVPGARLEYDGHLAELGHRRLSELLASFIERRELLPKLPGERGEMGGHRE